MESVVLISLQSISLFIVLIGLLILITTFDNFYGGMGYSIAFSYLSIILYNSLEIFILTRPSIDNILTISRISSAVLGLGIYLIHYFHDELSAIYRERRTMTIGSVLFGLVISGAWFEGAININPDTGAPFVHPLYGALILLQGTFAIHRITSHLIKVSELTDHYQIQSTISTRFRNIIQKALLGALILSIGLMFFIQDIISLPFAIIISILFLALAILYKLDPISSVPIAQPMKAIALINNDRVKFLHIFSPESTEMLTRNDFASLMTNLGRLFADITKTESSITSMTAGNAHLMFQPCGNDVLVLLLERRAPFVRRILHNLSLTLAEKPVDNQINFSQTVENYLLYP